MPTEIELQRLESAPMPLIRRDPPSARTSPQRTTSIQRSTSVLDGPKIRKVKRSVTEFFLGKDSDDYIQKWNRRCHRLHSSRTVGGDVRRGDVSRGTSNDFLDMTDNSVFDTLDHVHAAAGKPGHQTPHIIDPLANSGRFRGFSRSSKSSHAMQGPAARQISHLSTASSSRRFMRPQFSQRARKVSVLKMATDGFKQAIQRQTSKPRTYLRSRSFAPDSLWGVDDMDSIRSPTLDSVFSPAAEEILDEPFFDVATPTSYLATPFAAYKDKGDHPLQDFGADGLPTIEENVRLSRGTRTSLDQKDFPVQLGRLSPKVPPSRKLRPPPLTIHHQYDGVDFVPSRPSPRPYPSPLVGPSVQAAGAAWDQPVKVKVVKDESEHDELIASKPLRGGWRDGKCKVEPLPSTPGYLRTEDTVDAAGIVEGIDRFSENIKKAVYDWKNSQRRQVGKGFVGDLFQTTYREDLTQETWRKIEDLDEHRPFFTYWATFVQIVVYIVAVVVYGVAPLGFQDTLVTGEVLKPTLSIEQVSFFEKDNFWIGPRQADLIHMGAKYSPCMRADSNVEAAILADRELEKETACCVRNDGAGCMQTLSSECSPILSMWYKWSESNPGPDGLTSGSVCGQNPRYCNNPMSTGAYEWPKDDITEWPICLEPTEASQSNETRHMTCEVIARPCCVGIQGECLVTTREYCDFRKGYFHEEAALCSQVSCMSEICGMIPFHDPDTPDQFYRLWTSLFLHAGLLQLLVTVLFQYFVMRDVEKLAGWLRTTIIYLCSGIAGSLGSSIFLPYHVEAGPSGAQFGIIACLFAELFQNFLILKNPWIALLKRLILLLLLFALGLLPYVDNYAHLFGFIYGFFLSFALLPFIGYNPKDRRCKIVGIVLCLLISIGLVVMLVVLFYVFPIYDCPYCHYFNCIPFTNKMCKSMEVKIGRDEVY